MSIEIEKLKQEINLLKEKFKIAEEAFNDIAY